MKKRSAYSLIYVGLLVRAILTVKKTDSVQFLKESIDDLGEAIDKSGLEVSKKGFTSFILPFKSEINSLAGTDDVGESISKKINSKMSVLEDIIYSESSLKYIYIIPQRRFNGEYLSSTPKFLLNKDVFEKLPEMAVYDFSSSCRCLLYGEATASAFHVLRATEEVLKHFYFKYKKTNRLSKPMWGPMTSELRAKKTNKPNEIILNTLDLVRTSYRNPTQHPESKYDIESAQDLFGICIDLINKMASELETR